MGRTRSFAGGIFVALAVVAATPPARAQQKPLSLDAIFDPDTKERFSGAPVTGLVWTDEKHYAWPKPETPGSSSVEWLKVEAASGRSEPLFDRARMVRAFSKAPGMSEDEANSLSRSPDLNFNSDFTGALITFADDLSFYRFGTDEVVRLTSTPDEEEEATFSPDGRLVAFIRRNNLYVVDLADRKERALTSDGSERLLNGKLDWVYQEELYGRDNYQGYWWSPDSSHIAFLQLDESSVPSFTVVDHLPYRQSLETWPYPKAGDANPKVRVGIVPSSGGAVAWADTSKYAAIDFLVVDLGWKSDSSAVVVRIQDREQTWLDLNVADRGNGQIRTLLRETTKAWVNRNQNPSWLADGSFLWLSERTGWKHIYHYKADGTLIQPVTQGQWEARTLSGVDETGGWIYFTGTERSSIDLDLYRVRLDGRDFTRLSSRAGTHAPRFSPAFSGYIDVWNDITTPPQTRLHHADGREWRVIDDNVAAALKEYRLATPEFLEVKTRDGFVMNAMMIKPPDFDPKRRYPVLQLTYGGPHAPEVQNEWSGTEYMYRQLVAQQGIIIWVCDNRTASGKGAVSAWPLHHRLGEPELQDIEDGVAWLKLQPFVDGSRLGIQGWSYGGFMTSYALTHSTSFRMGIAGGTVADWRDYDTIYTERYMGRPESNAEGYRKSAPRFAAASLHGALLLIHGTIDDNVHMQNTMQFAYALQQAGKRFELMLYPKSRHGVVDPPLIKHLRLTTLAFTVRTLVAIDETSN